MRNGKEKEAANETPDWFRKLLPVISAVLGFGALWYTWYRYHDMANWPAAPWSDWIRLGFMSLLGILCLAASILLLLGRPSGMQVFTGGLAMVPLMLVSNLIIFGFRMIYRLIQEGAQPLWDHLLQPKNAIIPIIVIALALLSSLTAGEKKEKSE
ncbi:hypothetical protein QJQ58_07950 [Paenibacillus dendritiformis]|uniref:hypothetical protein n=1 Tax=Paenibacillus dendritiformis TaxID=130049 RepID=UPI00248D377D|nr:hypothetical protein [Paenibacillus dendritiformis]WGU96168.1 hypothetical protein QJQ58_07950 [Paenibacillus dendritiformis]